MPSRILDYELSQLPARVDGLDAFDRAFVIVRIRGVPVGRAWVPVRGGSVLGRDIRERVVREDNWDLWERLVRSRLEVEPTNMDRIPPATVAVVTRDRPDDLRACLDSLSEAVASRHRIMVVDNCPSTPAAKRLAAERPGVHYVREDTPGAAAARNRALREAENDIVAFTDDDARPEPGWLEALLRNFEDPLVLCVTGLVLPQELETEAQELFERHSTFSRGHNRLVLDGTLQHPLTCWRAGASASMALRRDILRRVGGFRECLGPGTPSRTGEDHELFARVLRGGYRIVYDPAAVSRHRHRRTRRGLRRTFSDYGVGVYAHWTHNLVAEGELSVPRFAAGWLLRGQIPALLRSLRGSRRAVPVDLSLAQLAGCLTGPVQYLRARREQRRNTIRRGGTESASVEGPPGREDAPDAPGTQQGRRGSGVTAREGPRHPAPPEGESGTVRAMSASPPVSVIIPTLGRWRKLEELLESLGRQRWPSGRLDVVVAADGCGREALDRVRRLRTPYRLRVSPTEERRGPAAARNRGAKLATGKFLIFLDDDVRASEDLVGAHVRSLGRVPDGAVVGRLVHGDRGPAGFFRATVRAWWTDSFLELGRPGHRFNHRDVYTGNLSMSRSTFHDLGGFDEELCVHEDWEFGWRLLESGRPLDYAADAVAIHRDDTDLDRFYRRMRGQGRADVKIGQRHPAARADLDVGQLASPSSRLEALLCSLVFRFTEISELGARALQRALLPAVEFVGSRDRWRWIFFALRRYWYFRGVADELESRRALDRFVQEAPSRRDRRKGASPATVDLADGLDRAERRLDRERPAAATVVWGDETVGRMPFRAGAEDLRGAHLRPFLVEHSARVLAVATGRELFAPGGSESASARGDGGAAWLLPGTADRAGDLAGSRRRA